MNHQEIMEVGAIALGALALLMVLRRGGSPDAVAVSDNPTTGLEIAPTYLTRNQPSSYAGNNVGPSLQSPSGGSSATPCACGSSPVYFSSLQSFSDALVAVDENIANSYQAQIMAAMPSWLGEFINNTFAPEQMAAAQGDFSAMAGNII